MDAFPQAAFDTALAFFLEVAARPSREYCEIRDRDISGVHLMLRHETHYGVKFLVVKQIEFEESLCRRGIWSKLVEELVEHKIKVLVQSIVEPGWLESFKRDQRWTELPNCKASFAMLLGDTFETY
jgi:hypothetical protein